MFLLLLHVACKEANSQKKYTIFSGKIKNNTAKNLFLKWDSYWARTDSGGAWKKKIAIAADGTFKDTLYLDKIPTDSTPSLQLTDLVFPLDLDQKHCGFVLLERGQDLHVTFDANKPQSKEFSGAAAPNNSYIQEKMSIDPRAAFSGDKEAIRLLKRQLAVLSQKYDISPVLRDLEKERNKDFFEDIEKKETQKQHKKGDVSTGFTYENYKGGTTSLSDFKGKYVYIDLWATWCGPCVREIPFLKQIEKKYHHKNIAFVSISLDDDKAAWRKMIKDYPLEGIQLIADKNKGDFLKNYYVNSIPRFILLDTEGKIIDPQAPRPSEARLKTMLDNLLK